MLSSGSIGGHTFGALTLGGGIFSEDLPASSAKATGVFTGIATRRVRPQGTARPDVALGQDAIRRRLAIGKALGSIAFEAEGLPRATAGGLVLVSGAAMLAPVRRMSADGDLALSSLIQMVVSWRYLRPTEWARIVFVNDRRGVITLRERRTIRVTDRDRTIRVPPERDL